MCIFTVVIRQVNKVGIEVSSNKEVSFNNFHHELLDTSTRKNPSIKKLQGLMVYSVFRRKRHKSHTQDGNPLIHALKANQGYHIEKKEIVLFLPDFYRIIDKFLDGNSYNLILPLPSSHRINEYLARRIARKCPKATIECDFFGKKTVAEVINDLEQVEILSKSLKRDVKQLLNRLNKAPPSKHFSMKDVHNHKVRKMIQPIKLIADISNNTGKVLLVDDLLASGTTLLNAYNLLKNKNINASAICLFSGLN